MSESSEVGKERIMVVSVKGADLFYSTRGRGPAALVLSLVGTKPYERQMPQRLSDHLQLVFVDLRGGGQSTGDPADFTLDGLAEDLEAIRADLGVPQVVVVGHSILGALAIEYGRRCPASVSHVITVGTPPRGDMAWLGTAARSFYEQDASEDRKTVMRENLARLPPNPSFEDGMLAQTPVRFFDPRIDAAPFYAGAIVKPELLAHATGALTDWDVSIDAASLRVPTLLTHGRYDYTVPYIVWDGIASTIPNATFRLFERSGHQPFCEEPDLFVDAVTSWMAAHPCRSPMPV
jgi:proline iminopeptidase